MGAGGYIVGKRQIWVVEVSGGEFGEKGEGEGGGWGGCRPSRDRRCNVCGRRNRHSV